MRGEDIAKRLRTFAATTIKLCGGLPGTVPARHIARQLVRAATGGGANYEEARGAESTADFVHKLGIASKELRESRYWLQLVEETALVDADAVRPLLRESDELVAILIASIKTARLRLGEPENRNGKW